LGFFDSAANSNLRTLIEKSEKSLSEAPHYLMLFWCYKIFIFRPIVLETETKTKLVYCREHEAKNPRSFINKCKLQIDFPVSPAGSAFFAESATITMCIQLKTQHTYKFRYLLNHEWLWPNTKVSKVFKHSPHPRAYYSNIFHRLFANGEPVFNLVIINLKVRVDN